MGGLVDEVEVELPIDSTEEAVSHFEDIDVPHGGIGELLAKRQFHGFGRAQVAGADGRGQDENTQGHAKSFRTENNVGCRERL